jgi:hypothetical protein
MIFCHAEMISGFVFGAEHVEGSELDDDEITNYISIDLFFFRIVLEFAK